MRKRIFFALLLIAAFALMLGINCYAAETDNEDSEINSDAVYREGEEQTTADAPSFFERIGEYITSGQVFDLLGLVAALALLLVANSLKKLCRNLFGRVTGELKSGASVTERQGENTLKRLDVLDKKLSSLDELGKKIDVVESALVDLLDMLDIVYQGSSTVPAVVKERIAKKHDHAQNLLEGAKEK